MKTHLQDPSKRLVWLRLGMIAVVLFGVITLLLMTNSAAPVEAAPELTLQPGDLLIVTPDGGCNLKIASINPTKTRSRLECETFTPTATATETQASGLVAPDDESDLMTSEVVFAPEAKINRTIKPGKKLIVLAAATCKLKVVDETVALVKIKCKPNPIPTNTPTRTRPPTRTNTPKPAQANLYIRNLTGGTLCYEVYNTGIGQKCFGGGDSFYGSFPPGTYSYHVQAVCGSLTDSFNLKAGDWLQTWGCNSGINARMDQRGSDIGNPGAPATPSR